MALGPPDPFRADGTPDLGPFAANAYAMFLALTAAGFREDQALRFTIDITTAMMNRWQPPAPGLT